MDMAAVDLTAPPIAHFDLTVTRRCPIPDYEVIGQSILHMPNVAMIVVEHLGVSLSRAAIVHNDELPLRISMIRRRAIDLRPDRAGQVAVTRAAPALAAAVEEPIPKAGPLFRTGFFDGEFGRFLS